MDQPRVPHHHPAGGPPPRAGEDLEMTGNTVHADGPNDPLPMNLRTADLPRRLASAAVMLAVTALAVGIGGLVLDGFIALVALVAFVEFALLVARATPNLAVRLVAW